MSSFIDQIKWNQDGLLPVVTVDANSRRVLMQAWVNSEALEITVSGGSAVYWSRSRGKLWKKGEQSGNTQRIVDVYLDCDNDSLLYEVEQKGGIACHTGRESCFYQKYKDGKWLVNDPVLKDPSSIYDKQ
ncbi:MAG: phosphoribosyl-AMP cyclohydrolase [Pseudohongiellaceae bacterium]|jgi:phosphoribosyl-AMP cyclohydrolase|nr:phosphoribosyl-AMP cyclohydrolase [Gammaproteobacteria bacterium]|tara:strand:+ start:269 stop:658 length:390 start_codon:yes stop_codon:yes gene_type:complete